MATAMKKPAKRAPTPDSRPPIVLPPDAMAALKRAPRAKAVFAALSYTNRKEFAESITGAKHPETRVRRIARMIEKLTSQRPTLSNTVSTRPTVEKMRITPGQAILVIDADEAAMKIWRKLPKGCTLSRSAGGKQFDVVVLYPETAAALAKRLPATIKACAADGVIWIGYPKLTSGRATTLTRDIGWQPVEKSGLQGVTMIAFDDVWAGVKYRLPGARA